MQADTTRQLFAKVIAQRGIHEKLGLTSDQVRTIRFNHAKGKVSEEKMAEILTAAGYTIVQERLWALKA